jgi:hypothetical protein
MKAFPESAAQAVDTGSLDDLPASDLPPDLAKSTNEAWERMQVELAHLCTRGTQTIAKNSAHYIQIDRSDVVVDAIRSIVEQARQTPPRP